MKKKFEFLEHTADIKFKAWGKTLEEIFENSALAVSDYISRGGKIKPVKNKEIKVEGQDIKELFYNFLDELLYLLDADGFVVSKAKVKIDNKKLNAVIYGDNASHYEGLNPIKSATYAEMYIKKFKLGWEAQAVMDV